MLIGPRNSSVVSSKLVENSVFPWVKSVKISRLSVRFMRDPVSYSIVVDTVRVKETVESPRVKTPDFSIFDGAGGAMLVSDIIVFETCRDIKTFELSQDVVCLCNFDKLGGPETFSLDGLEESFSCMASVSVLCAIPINLSLSFVSSWANSSS